MDFYSFACHVEGDGRGGGGGVLPGEKGQEVEEIGEKYAELCNIP